jgi:hypothetical protein
VVEFVEDAAHTGSAYGAHGSVKAWAVAEEDYALRVVLEHKVTTA